ncbi:MAG: ribosomal RNA small subunit methyltransferase A [Deltaproteobacteria bacterium]|nr:ribosomal RNA small subunit methyltransferase A [Deltaproteobacteria bacterium]
MVRPALAPKKSLGQHFLHDQRVLARIADMAVAPATTGVVEIGPGTGNLTEHLIAAMDRLATPPPLLLIEVDQRTPQVLRQRFGERFALHMGDAAEVDWPARLDGLGTAPSVVGNLPYYAAMPIVFALLDSPRQPERVVVMVQREVAERMAAGPGGGDRGQVSVKLQLRAEVELAFRVGRGAFQPPPNVDSAVVVLRPRPCPWPLPEWSVASHLIGDGFALRRKTLVNALTSAGWPAAEVRANLQSLGLRPTARAEELDNPSWAALAVGLRDHAPRTLTATTLGKGQRRP